jgi:hypothetical protein
VDDISNGWSWPTVRPENRRPLKFQQETALPELQTSFDPKRPVALIGSRRSTPWLFFAAGRSNPQPVRCRPGERLLFTLGAILIANLAKTGKERNLFAQQHGIATDRSGRPTPNNNFGPQRPHFLVQVCTPLHISKRLLALCLDISSSRLCLESISSPD